MQAQGNYGRIRMSDIDQKLEAVRKLEAIWKQKEVPVIFLKERKGRPMIKAGDGEKDTVWIRDFGSSYGGSWQQKYNCWVVPKAWFTGITKKLLSIYGRVYVVQPFSENEKCCPACWNATGIECTCSCQGANHGSGQPAGKWYIVSDTFAAKRGDRHYGCKLITPFFETDIF